MSYLGCVFYEQKTAYELRISDWSSDVCSSDLLGPFLAPVTLVDSLNFRPCLPRMRWVCLPISASMVGRMRSRNSTTVTSAPRRDHTEPISRPMTPAPITTMLPGSFSSASAPVEVTICFSSVATPGRGPDSDDRTRDGKGKSVSVGVDFCVRLL